MNLRLAEIGIIFITCSNFPFFGVPFVGLRIFIILGLVFPFADPKIVYGFFCVITTTGLVLLVSDTKGFLQHMKSHKIVSALLIILGLILIGASFFMISASNSIREYYNTKIPEHPLTSEELIIYSLFNVWAGLALLSAVIWIIYGLIICTYKETDFPPLKQEVSEFQTKNAK